MTLPRLLKHAVGWGLLLWFIGYLLGFILFFVVPPALLGWVIMPIGTAMTLWILVKKIKTLELKEYAVLSVVWTLIAIGFDYLFIVQLLKPADGYYKPDVYLYYTVTFLLPLLVGQWKRSRSKPSK